MQGGQGEPAQPALHGKNRVSLLGGAPAQASQVGHKPSTATCYLSIACTTACRRHLPALKLVSCWARECPMHAGIEIFQLVYSSTCNRAQIAGMMCAAHSTWCQCDADAGGMLPEEAGDKASPHACIQRLCKKGQGSALFRMAQAILTSYSTCRRDTSEESGGEASGSSPTAGAGRPKALRKTASKNRHRRPPLRAPAFEVGRRPEACQEQTIILNDLCCTHCNGLNEL